MATLELLERAIGGLEGRGTVSTGLEKALTPLRVYDAQRGADLERTLYVFVQQGGNIAGTAEALFLHRNSVAYRLQRIEDVSGLDLRDWRTRNLLFTGLALVCPDFLVPSGSTSRRSTNESERPE